jgi:hypothetical protein
MTSWPSGATREETIFRNLFYQAARQGGTHQNTKGYNRPPWFYWQRAWGTKPLVHKTVRRMGAFET